MCSVDGCTNRATRLKGTICEAHYYRIRRTGSVGSEPVKKKQPPGPCEIDGCGKPRKSRGWCHAHYTQWQRTGDPENSTPYSDRAWATGPANNNWKGDEVGYTAAHDRTRRRRGRACDHPCEDCGQPAAQWSLDHAATATRTDPITGLRYSTDPADYTPRCPSCHKQYDHRHRSSHQGATTPRTWT